MLAVRHLHAFTREVDLTAKEWLEGLSSSPRLG